MNLRPEDEMHTFDVEETAMVARTSEETSDEEEEDEDWLVQVIEEDGQKRAHEQETGKRERYRRHSNFQVW